MKKLYSCDPQVPLSLLALQKGSQGSAISFPDKPNSPAHIPDDSIKLTHSITLVRPPEPARPLAAGWINSLSKIFRFHRVYHSAPNIIEKSRFINERANLSLVKSLKSKQILNRSDSTV